MLYEVITILGINILGTAHCCKAAIPSLRHAGGGTIVNVSSVYGVMGRRGMGQYDTTKAAILGYTRALAQEEAEHGIRVNTVCPGGTITPYHIARAAQRGVSENQILPDVLAGGVLDLEADLARADPVDLGGGDSYNFV